MSWWQSLIVQLAPTLLAIFAHWLGVRSGAGAAIGAVAPPPPKFTFPPMVGGPKGV